MQMQTKAVETLFDNSPNESALPVPMQKDPHLIEIAERLPLTVRLGASSWNFPGWRGIVYGRSSGSKALASLGLRAYAQYPIFKTVGLDRNFYRPLDAGAFAAFAEQVPQNFRFLVKAPRETTDPYLRYENGRPHAENPNYLNVTLAQRNFLAPVQAGLGDKAGPLVFQFSPFPHAVLRDVVSRQALVERIGAYFKGLREANIAGYTLAAEFRNYELLTPRMMNVMKEYGIRPVLGLHPAMPGVRRQIDALRYYETGVRASAKDIDNDVFDPDWRFSGTVIIRWSLAAHRFYDTAKRDWHPFDVIHAADPVTRALLAGVLVRAARSRVEAFMVANNKAEGCAPKTMAAIADLVVRGLAATSG